MRDSSFRYVSPRLRGYRLFYPFSFQFRERIHEAFYVPSFSHRIFQISDKFLQIPRQSLDKINLLMEEHMCA